MLRNLFIRDFVIVKQTDISFAQGFTVFSGETGAGKSILIDALSLALGGRTDTSLIREGAKRTDISAVFEAPNELQSWLDEQLIDGPELILRRVIDQQGRSKAYINGMPVTLGQLKTISQRLVDIHGQHAHQSLLQTATQRDILDAQAKILDQVSQLGQLWQEWQTAQKNLNAAKTDAAAQKERLTKLKLDIDYLEKLKPQVKEWEDLCNQQSRLAHGQALLAGTSQAITALDGEANSAITSINTAINSLSDILRHDSSLEIHIETLESARIACTETVSSLNTYIDKLELSPDLLNKTEDRMSALFEASRRLQTEPENLNSYLDNLYIDLEQLNTATDIVALENKCSASQQKYFALAKKISQQRQKAAIELGAKVSKSMQELAMQGGQLQVAVKESKPGPHGVDEIEFLVAGHQGVKPKALNKVASGGELARISLSLSVIASLAARVPTLIFDEVDAGIGGGVAEVVGRLLKELGARHQVLCVTHLPQVAAQASQHYKVSKASHDNQTISQIDYLDEAGRINEIARMLGGLEITQTTLSHASEMLNQAKL